MTTISGTADTRPIRAVARPILDHLVLWSSRRHTRRQLRTMDAHQLSDIGLSPDEALTEG
ncbi:MAG: DUF1127 domain-containing protein [Inquilinus limosus]|uniref:DUF1127 domain-containing protein n=1 Tax=Inquilinus limosus TaxID=171674 RepID=A0A952KHT2_9PROT|nr:DUF1127 domain-containing protein [Inquilinus limosus]